MQQKIGFIGGGNMGEALIKGILKSGVSSRQAVFVSDIRSDRLKDTSEKLRHKNLQGQPDRRRAG